MAQIPRHFWTWFRSRINLPKTAKDGELVVLTAFSQLYGDNNAMAMRVLNEEFKKNYPMRRYNDWRRGYRTVPPYIMDFMRQQIIMSRFEKNSARDLCRLLGLKLPGEDLL